jgi:hypothetical protein
VARSWHAANALQPHGVGAGCFAKVTCPPFGGPRPMIPRRARDHPRCLTFEPRCSDHACGPTQRPRYRRCHRQANKYSHVTRIHPHCLRHTIARSHPPPRADVWADCKGNRAPSRPRFGTYRLPADHHDRCCFNDSRAVKTMSRVEMVEADVKGGAAVGKPADRDEVNASGRNDWRCRGRDPA